MQRRIISLILFFLMMGWLTVYASSVYAAKRVVKFREPPVQITNQSSQRVLVTWQYNFPESRKAIKNSHLISGGAQDYVKQKGVVLNIQPDVGQPRGNNVQVTLTVPRESKVLATSQLTISNRTIIDSRKQVLHVTIGKDLKLNLQFQNK